MFVSRIATMLCMLEWDALIIITKGILDMPLLESMTKKVDISLTNDTKRLFKL